MTAVQAAPASPPAPPEELTTPELARSAIFSDAVVIARRNLTRIARTPQLMVFATIQPVMFVLLFRYVFGGAIHVPGISYVDFLIPGVIVQTVVFGATSTAVGLSQDMSNGIIDRFRFRSLPMSRSAVLAGRTIADLVRNVFVVLLMIVVGMAVGFRFHNGFLPAVAAVFVALPIGYALSWVFALIGLTVADPETAQLAGFLPIFPLVSPARSSSRSRACPAGCRPSPKTSPLAEPPAPCGPSPKAAPSPLTSSGPSCGAPPSWPSSSPGGPSLPQGLAPPGDVRPGPRPDHTIRGRRRVLLMSGHCRGPVAQEEGLGNQAERHVMRGGSVPEYREPPTSSRNLRTRSSPGSLR